MKRHKKKPMEEIPAASLADIAFLLLIFFIVTTIFALEEGIPLVLPGKTASDVKVKKDDLMVIQAQPDGSIVVDKEVVALGSLRALVQRRLTQNEKLVTVIETHPDSDYGLMIDILDELRLADARRISLKSMKSS